MSDRTGRVTVGTTGHYMYVWTYRQDIYVKYLDA